MGLILIRYSGEIGIKGKNRHYFVKRLRHNLRDALKRHDIEGKVWSEGQRVYAEVDDEARDAALSAFTRVFGIASVSPVERVPSDLAVIRAQALALAERAGLDPSMSFRVQTRRADKAFPYISPEVNRLVGSTIYEAMHARVDLSDSADVTIGIEIRSQGTLIYGQVLPGQGGLPLGSQGRVFVLLSGGIDSPVAAWLMMRRGCGVIPLHFSQNEIEREKALANCQVLERWSYGWQIKPIVLDQGELLEPVIDQLVEMGKERWICVFCKRAMIARAAQLAPAYRVQALVMGDSLGQVASQTLGNLAAISYEAELPILRP
ncbi:MAG: tRNA uracil 4-sulfurtransferase ThiI, partial [Anaerolineae bacterium]